MATLYAVTVDTEEEWQWSQGWPTGRPRVSNVRRLEDFQNRCERYGALVTYFTNYAVWDDSASRDIMLRLASRSGVELGMHIHPWNTPPILDNQSVPANDSFLANLPDLLAFAKLEAVYQKFLRNGIRPRSFRGGRYSSGEVVHRFLNQKGFVADASVVPFTNWRDAGAPDYRDRNIFPVRRTSPGSTGGVLWEVPLTMGFTRQPFEFWQRIFDNIAKSRLRHLRLIGIAERLNLIRRVWLNFEDPLGRQMDAFLKLLRRLRPPCICFTLHSSSLEVGANGCYTNTERERQQLFERVEQALRLVSSWNEFRPATVTQIGTHLEDEYNASSRN
jgi:hypothetical protein